MEDFKTFVDNSSVEALVQVFYSATDDKTASAYSAFLKVAAKQGLDTSTFTNPSSFKAKCVNVNSSIAKAVLGDEDDEDEGFGWQSLNEDQQSKFFATAKQVNDDNAAQYYNQGEMFSDVVKIEDLNDVPENIIDMKALNIFANLHHFKWGHERGYV